VQIASVPKLWPPRQRTVATREMGRPPGRKFQGGYVHNAGFALALFSRQPAVGSGAAGSSRGGDTVAGGYRAWCAGWRHRHSSYLQRAVRIQLPRAHMVTGGGLHGASNLWIPRVYYNDDCLMKAWRRSGFGTKTKSCVAALRWSARWRSSLTVGPSIFQSAINMLFGALGFLLRARSGRLQQPSLPSWGRNESHAPSLAAGQIP
jgi:hypothetical protein